MNWYRQYSKLIENINTDGTKVLIQKIVSTNPDKDFIGGDCMYLAVTLLLARGTGKLFYAIRTITEYDDEDDEEGTEMTSFSHMIYEDEHGQEWDVNGNNASGTWDEYWNIDDYGNEVNNISEFEWQQCSIDEVPSICAKWNVKYDPNIPQEMLRKIGVNNE